MVEEKVGVNITEEPSQIRNLAVGIGEKGFLLAFNCDDKGVPEKTFSIEPEVLSGIIEMLFESGMRYQEETGVDIGFGTVGEDDEDADKK